MHHLLYGRCILAKETVGEAAFEIGADAAGEVVGIGVGALVAGPAGAIGGAVLGSVASHALLSVKNEFLGRLLTAKEQQRVLSVADMTRSTIERNLNQGKTPRDDGFFDGSVDDRSSAEEIFEGTLIAAQREYEERKLPLLANLTANIAFDESISPGMANRLLKLAAELTYQEILVLRVLGLLEGYEKMGLYPSDGGIRKKEAYNGVDGLAAIAVASDVFSLYRSSLVYSTSAILDAGGINPSDLYIAGYGALLFNLMELGNMVYKDSEATSIYEFLVDAEPRPEASGD